MQDADLPFCVDDREDENEIHLCAGDSRKKIVPHHVLLIATPEFDDERSGPLKSSLGWAGRVSGSTRSCLGRLVNTWASLISWLVNRFDEIRLQMTFRRALIRLGTRGNPQTSKKLKGKATKLQEKSECNSE